MAKMDSRKTFLENLPGDFFGGTAAMLVALPSAIAFGLIIFAPLGAEFSSMAAIGGIVGTIAIGIITPTLGGTRKLVSAPCAPAAAVLSVFTAELVKKGSIPLEVIPIYITLVALFAGIVQLILGKLGGGKFIKYIPYPVVAGYLSGVGTLIFIGQFPRFLGLQKEIKLWDGLFLPEIWKWESICIATVTIIVMIFSSKIIQAIPAAIIALMAGIITYFGISTVNPSLLQLENNPFVIGTISASTSDLANTITHRWSLFSDLNFSTFSTILVPVLTLAALLSIDTLKTCVVIDSLTYSRHDSNRELIGQGFGNIASAILCGIPGAGTMGATVVNLGSGARSRVSGVIVGIMALLVFLLFGNLIAWIPISALAGILMVIAIRMIDKKSFTLLKHKATILDFVVIFAVVISAVTLSLITAAGVGIAFAILLFLREQMQTSVIRRKFFGNQIFSKRNRLASELSILEEKGSQMIIIELQGQLFFGTTDQLYTKLEPFLSECKYALLDMRRVQSVDYTAVNMLKQILARIKEKNGYLIFSSIPLNLPTGQNVKIYFENLGLSETDNLKFFENIDDALEWAEDEILSGESTNDRKENKILELPEIELFAGFSNDVLKTFSNFLIKKNYQPNELIFNARDTSDEIYFVRKGLIKILLPLANGNHYHLVTIGNGGIFGEMAFIDKRKRSADAISMDDSQLYILSRSKFEEIREKYPEVAGVFFERLALLIANRLRQSDKELKAFQEN